MEYTPNASFKKPGYDDPVDIADINGNFDIADTHIGGAITSQGGIHGVRYSNATKQFEVYDEDKGAWVGIDAARWSELGTLDEASWETISAASQAGIAPSCWSVGDPKAVHLQGTVGTLALDSTLYVYILGFNHNKALEGGGIHFGGFKTAALDGVDVCLTDAKYGYGISDGTKWFNMSHWGYSNHGGWAGCDQRYDILGSTDKAPSGYGKLAAAGRVGYDASATTATNPVANTLMAALPADLRAVMKPITKYTDNVGGGGDDAPNKVTATVDYLPLLSECEVFGNPDISYGWHYSNRAEWQSQRQYDYFLAGNTRIKSKHSATATRACWWLRSPDRYVSSGFCSVITGGGPSGYYAGHSWGLAAALAV